MKVILVALLAVVLTGCAASMSVGKPSDHVRCHSSETSYQCGGGGGEAR
jgi:uncharacterized protein YceK